MTPREIERARAIDIGGLARAAGLKLRGRANLEGPCPHCAGRNRFWINARTQAFGCRGCGQGEGGYIGSSAIDFTCFVWRVEFREAVERLIGAQTRSSERMRPVRPVLRPRRRIDHRSVALAIWRDSVPAEATPVETYLARRKVGLPSSEVIRFHPRCPFAGVFVPTMIALVRNIRTNEPQAIHRTALDLAGNKIEVDGKARLALGAVLGGAIKLTADEDVTTALGIGEGIETTLSLQQLSQWFGSPVWSLIDAAGIRAFPVLPGIETLFIAVDHDRPDLRGRRAGQAAASEVNARWLAAKREVLLAHPATEAEDINDVI